MKPCITIVLFIISSVLLAQTQEQISYLNRFENKKLTYGFLIGLNSMDYKIIHAKDPEPIIENRYADVKKFNPGLNIGMIINYRINNNFNLRITPGLILGQRDLLYSDKKVDDNNTSDFDISHLFSSAIISSTYLEIPLIIKLNSAKTNKTKPYFIGGINFRYDLSTTKKAGIMINPFDIYWELGGGVESYFNYFRLSTEFKISIGTFNILNSKGTGDYFEDLYYTKPLEKLFSRIFILTFYFE